MQATRRTHAVCLQELAPSLLQFAMQEHAGAGVKQHRSEYPSLCIDALPCAVIVDELGLHRPPRYKGNAGNAKGKRRCYHAITLRESSRK